MNLEEIFDLSIANLKLKKLGAVIIIYYYYFLRKYAHKYSVYLSYYNINYAKTKLS